MRSSWIAGALVSSLWMTGCAGNKQERSDEARLGRIPMEQKQPVYTAQHNVSVAQANQQAAERGVEQAKTFRDIAKNEHNAAQKRMDAGRDAANLARKSGSPDAANVAEQNLDLGERALTAQRAKLDYSERLVSLREAQKKLTDKQLEAATAQFELAKASALKNAGMQPEANVADLMRKRDSSEADVANAEREVSALRDETQSMQTAWEQARGRFSAAVQKTPVAPPITAPPAPKQVEPEPLHIPTPKLQ